MTTMDFREKMVELLREAPYNIFGNKLGNCYFDSCLELIADHLIANGVTVQEWISVKDRLPKYKDGKVLAFTQYGYTICQRARNGRWKGQYSNWITDWAYLPPPPETEYGYLQNVMTNADHIRNMTDKELAEFLSVKAMMKWLQQPVKEEQ